MYKFVPKRTIKRIENNDEDEEFRIMKLTLELAKRIRRRAMERISPSVS